MVKNKSHMNKDKKEGGKRRNKNMKGGDEEAVGLDVVENATNNAKVNVVSNNATNITVEGGKSRTKKGKNKTRKASKGRSEWTNKVMKVYHDMKKANPATKLGDAMKKASMLKKKGQL